MSEKRDKYPPRRIRLVGENQRVTAMTALRNAPIDPGRPLEVLIREEVKARKLDQNALMWRGPLFDISEQAYVSGRTYSAEVWHEQFKIEHLPEEFDPELCKEGYRKWDITPRGGRILVGSTTDLTVKGFSEYLEKIHADGASLGVDFHANPRERHEH